MLVQTFFSHRFERQDGRLETILFRWFELRRRGVGSFGIFQEHGAAGGAIAARLLGRFWRNLA
jgi:hypothetical protein